MILAEYFLIRAKIKHIRLEGMFDSVEKLCSVVFPIDFHGL